MPPTFFVIVVGASFEYPNNLSKQYYINYQANKKPNDKISKKKKKERIKIGLTTICSTNSCL